MDISKRIQSFAVNHDLLEKGLYLSRIDGNTKTYDLRFKKPNAGDYFTLEQAHTIEHLAATVLRNSEFSDKIVYFGPMGCATGFYLVVFDGLKFDDLLALLKKRLHSFRRMKARYPARHASNAATIRHTTFPAQGFLRRTMQRSLKTGARISWFIAHEAPYKRKTQFRRNNPARRHIEVASFDGRTEASHVHSTLRGRRNITRRNT